MITLTTMVKESRALESFLLTSTIGIANVSMITFTALNRKNVMFAMPNERKALQVEKMRLENICGGVHCADR